MFAASVRCAVEAALLRAVRAHFYEGAPPAPVRLVTYTTRARALLTAAIDHPSPAEGATT